MVANAIPPAASPAEGAVVRFMLRDDLTLPPGRFPLSFGEVESLWCFNKHRNELLDELRTFIDLLADKATIHTVWIGGSFLSGKVNPSDIDVTMLVSPPDFKSRSRLFGKTSLKSLAAHCGCRVDAYAIPRCNHQSSEPTESEYKELSSRGYWDSWWMRKRGHHSDKSTPQKGYVEVTIHGYE